MKILFLNHNLSGEGTFFRGFNFARNLVKRGHDVTLITVSQKKLFFAAKYKRDGVHIIEAPKLLDQHRGGWAPLDVLYKTGHCITHKYDIIHGIDHKPNVSFPSLFGKLFHPSSVFFSDWSDWWTKGGISAASRWTPEIGIETVLEEWIRKKADALTVTSLALKHRALSIGIPGKKIFYIPSGCDTDNIRPFKSSKVQRFKRKYRIPLKAPVMEFIGFGQGDVDTLVEAFNEAKKKVKNAVFLIVGPADKRVLSAVESSPYKKDIIITGRVEYRQIAEYASMADICLLPLRDNPANRGRGPIKAGDYMAAGKPIIANPVGDITQWIRKYRIGLTAGFTAKEMAIKIIYLFKHKALMRRMGANSLKTARNILSWKKVTEELEKVYYKVIKDR